MRARLTANRVISLLDVRDAGRGWLTLAREIRAHSDIGIIMLTAAAKCWTASWLEVAPTITSPSPFQLREVLARVKACCARKPSPAPAPRSSAKRRDDPLRRLAS